MDTVLHALAHFTGIDNPTGKFYLLWSGIAQFVIPTALGTLGYFRLKVHNKRHIDGLHNHISQEFSKLRKPSTEE